MTTKLPFTIPDRTIAHRHSDNGLLSDITVEQVTEFYRAILARRKAVDRHDFNVAELKVSFSDGVMSIRWPESDNTNYSMRISSWAASQLASYILPSRFFPGLRQLAQLSPKGAQLAEQTWHEFAQQVSSSKATIRTASMKINGEVYRVIRAVVTDSYADYSNESLLEVFLNHTGQFKNLPVLDWRLTDAGMRLRLVGMQDAVYGLAHFDQSVLDDEVVPMVECWNSEVGRRSLGLRGGIYLARSSAALTHWDTDVSCTWTHRGRLSRIQNEFQHSIEDMFESAQEVAAAYTLAKGVVVDNPADWMASLTKDELSDRVLEKAKQALLGDKVSPGGTLASVVEAIALAAKDEEDMYDQDAVEKVASRVLNKGIQVAAKNNNLINAPKAK